MESRKSRRTPLGFLAALLAAFTLTSCVTPAPHIVEAPGGWGKFSGPVAAEWLSDGREMKLLREVDYVEPEGRQWVAPEGATVDGASIPRPFWTLIGGPLEGTYRDASVIHDVACDTRTARWQDVHTMFYKAMRCRGVSEQKAKIMFAAVWYYGPRWSEPRKILNIVQPKPTLVAPPAPSMTEARAIADWVRDTKPTNSTITGLPESTPAASPKPAR